MTDNLQLRMPKKELIKHSPHSIKELVGSNKNCSALQVIKDNLSERIEKAKPSEIPELLAIFDSVQNLIDREIQLEADKMQVEATKKQLNLIRKIEITKTVCSLIAVFIGISSGLLLTLMNYDLIGPLFLIISLVKALDIAPRENENLLQIEANQDHLANYKTDKFYQLFTGNYLSLMAVILIFILVFADLSVAIQQGLIVIIGLLIFASLEAFKRGLHDEKKGVKQPTKN